MEPNFGKCVSLSELPPVTPPSEMAAGTELSLTGRYGKFIHKSSHLKLLAQVELILVEWSLGGIPSEVRLMTPLTSKTWSGVLHYSNQTLKVHHQVDFFQK